MMTSSRDVYAAGDCVETEDAVNGKNCLSLFWHNAKSQGEVIGYNCCGISKDYAGSLNLTSVDIFGIHAASFGSLEADNNQHDNIGVIEKSVGKNYYRLIVANGRLLGAQSIGDARDLGALLSVLLRKDNLNEVKQIVKRNLPPLNPLYYRTTRFLN
jgi:NAD(P)H-nitrite reductase large subunit